MKFCQISSFFWLKENLCVSHLSKALAAVDSLAVGGLEGHLAFLATVRTDGGEHFSGSLLRVLSCGTAILASLGLVLKALRCVELLLTGGEHEIVSAIFALQCLVLVHGFSFLA